MIKYKDNGIILKLYGECRNDIGIIECLGRRIDDDTTIVYKMFSSEVVRSGSLATDHNLFTLWLCTVDVFCKCGTIHPVSSDIPAKYQIFEILENIENHEDVSFMIPNEFPEGFLIVDDLEKKEAKKQVEDLNDWL